MKHILFLSFLALSLSCSSEMPMAPTPAPTPPQARPVPAVLRVVQVGLAEGCFSPVQGFKYRVSVPLTIMETAGTGLAINFINVDFYLDGQIVERQTIGADDIIRVWGTNRIEANSSLDGTFTFDFNSDGGALINIGYTDDSGVSGVYSIQNINVHYRPICILTG